MRLLSLQHRFSKSINLFKNSKFVQTLYWKDSVIGNLNSFVGHNLCNNFHNYKTVNKRRDFLLKKDGVSPEYELVYRAPMETYITIAKNISTITATIISSATIYAVTNEYKLSSPSLESMSLVTHPSDLWYFSFCFIAVTIVIRLFIAKYPLRIYVANDK